MAIFISILILAGCSRNQHTNREKAISRNNPSKKKSLPGSQEKQYPTRFRFYSQQDDDANLNDEFSQDENDAFQYYHPADGIVKITALQWKDIEIDQSQKKETFYSINNKGRHIDQSFIGISITSPEVVFVAVFDNDLFDNTDYYYTNGIKLEIYHPMIGASPIARVLPGLRNSINYYSLSLVQNMYTPLKLEEPEVRMGDRPFASYLTVGHQRTSLSPGKNRRMQSEFALGVMGPASLGNVSQDLIHTHEPVGWINQVSNDFIVNYNFSLDQGIYRGKGFEAAMVAGGQAGTLYDNITAGIYIQAGKANGRYSSIFQTTGHQKPFRKRIRYYFGLDIKNKLVFYDATLQGGMFNHESVYKIETGELKRYVFTGTLHFGMGLGRYSLEAEQVFMSPEFEGGRRHLWFRIKNIIYLN